jgi:hypothetical protein
MSDTVLKQVNYSLGDFTSYVELGEIGLPDIQRPFVSKNAKVRDLFDSMYQGYPVGYLLLWQNAYGEDSKVIGTDTKQKPPRLLIVDGQQRLTSLYAVVKGISVVRENYDAEAIEIAFNPLQEKFAVADAAIRRDKSYIQDISRVWSKDSDLFELVDDYFDGLESTREISSEERKQIRKAITKLHGLLSFPLTALELAANISEEQVADVFVRINSKGTPLNQAVFILTLMSVFWDEGRAELERFCKDARTPTSGKASPFNHFIHPDPDQLLRVSVGVGFKRARLNYVYSILRGKDLETEAFSAERRDAQFEVLKQAQTRVLNLQYWHDFLKAILGAGYRSGKLISSQNNLLFAYILYLMGRTEFGVEEYTLRRLISRWFFMSALTGRYTGSPESQMEFDLARFRGLERAEQFAGTLSEICESTLTSDFWTITLPNELATSAARSPSMFADFAALNLLDARVLYSQHKVAALMDPSTTGTKTSLERHHLFPKANLKTLGVTDNRETNQIASYTMVEWGDNLKISDQPPADYVPKLSERFSGKELERMYYWHALPDGWEQRAYGDFLRQRRELMAKVIRDAYHQLGGEQEPAQPSVTPVADMVGQGETTTVEFKSTLRINLHTGEKDPRMELAVLKTLAAFVNSSGGTLVIGVADDGEPVGIEADKFPNEDKMYLHLVNLTKDRMGAAHMMYMHPRFDDYEGVRVLAVECLPGRSPVFVKDAKVERFFVRTGAATTELQGNQAQEFIQKRFKG